MQWSNKCHKSYSRNNFLSKLFRFYCKKTKNHFRFYWNDFQRVWNYELRNHQCPRSRVHRVTLYLTSRRCANMKLWSDWLIIRDATWWQSLQIPHCKDKRNPWLQQGGCCEHGSHAFSLRVCSDFASKYSILHFHTKQQSRQTSSQWTIPKVISLADGIRCYWRFLNTWFEKATMLVQYLN